MYTNWFHVIRSVFTPSKLWLSEKKKNHKNYQKGKNREKKNINNNYFMC